MIHRQHLEAAGGEGGGGAGGKGPSGAGRGTMSTGGGGGGNQGRSGGSGIVVIRYKIASLETAKATGGVISFYNGKTIHVFTSSGTFTAPSPLNPSPLAATYVVVAGGGAGAGPGGGGGAGQYITGPSTITAGGSVTVQVGAGGVSPYPLQIVETMEPHHILEHLLLLVVAAVVVIIILMVEMDYQEPQELDLVVV